MPPKRKFLSLTDKVKALEMYDNTRSSRKVGAAFGVSKDQIQKLVKRKADVLEEFHINGPNDRCRKMRKTGDEKINEMTWKWFQDVTSRRVQVSGPLTQHQPQSPSNCLICSFI